MGCVHGYENADYCEKCNAERELDWLRGELDAEKSRRLVYEKLVKAYEEYVKELVADRTVLDWSIKPLFYIRDQIVMLYQELKDVV